MEEKTRLGKLSAIKKLGLEPFPAGCGRTHANAQALANFDQLAKNQITLTLAGRIMSWRSHGSSIFAHLSDGTGRLQVYFKKNELSGESFENLGLLDVGDFIEAEGILFKTKTGERTMLAKKWNILAKALEPLPEKWHGLRDVEARFRQRYLDILMNDAVRARMILRSRIIDSIRATMRKHNFLEVETPTLQPIYGGGLARPFKTRHNAHNADFYLRISDEMYLKRLLVGGFERVYEITKVFRNEGVDRDHNPEFTMFEAQAAYQDYHWGMDLFEEIFETAARDILGTTKIQRGALTIDVKRPWKRMPVTEAIKTITGIDAAGWKTTATAKKEAAGKLKNHPKRPELEAIETVGEIIAFIFEELVEEKLIEPTITYDYPVEVSPLAKKGQDPRFTKRFEGFALGNELGNNYSELNDPVDLAGRFMDEKKKALSGSAESHQTDPDYLQAIKHGMPPAFGFGIGVDRMVMLLTGADNIKEVILFPTLRPKNSEN